MTKAIKEAGRKTDPAVLKHIDRCAMFLIKALCLDNDADEAIITKTITYYGKRVGRYSITIKKI
ncbi:hypothetical protein GGQ85_003644 [Nitrobacter vulgaris]|uniref:hypothetical protein n=1 Tax=Nitrobacter vulgaris TaxID=29421 RepID=UPI00285E63ED|nr:hypothetical protein [Nitrobacter vulgaris]MDR6305918.1 hypothetical protein [Nitrobacter vulgaris]